MQRNGRPWGERKQETPVFNLHMVYEPFEKLFTKNETFGLQLEFWPLDL